MAVQGLNTDTYDGFRQESRLNRNNPEPLSGELEQHHYTRFIRNARRDRTYDDRIQYCALHPRDSPRDPRAPVGQWAWGSRLSLQGMAGSGGGHQMASAKDRAESLAGEVSSDQEESAWPHGGGWRLPL
ncbi:hypothetical protein FRB94_004774 [Tulasnella sp. JGI-2019a]|nr:hypothetical protein FRB94_004774 [Tulasnella sp. JGI-2019a]KAG9015375.1 hypothetical protein FRB93_013075 [Tulasnella sp. JGI-2019a]